MNHQVIVGETFPPLNFSHTFGFPSFFVYSPFVCNIAISRLLHVIVRFLWLYLRTVDITVFPCNNVMVDEVLLRSKCQVLLLYCGTCLKQVVTQGPKIFGPWVTVFPCNNVMVDEVLLRSKCQVLLLYHGTCLKQAVTQGPKIFGLIREVARNKLANLMHCSYWRQFWDCNVKVAA